LIRIFYFKNLGNKIERIADIGFDSNRPLYMEQGLSQWKRILGNYFNCLEFFGRKIKTPPKTFQNPYPETEVESCNFV